MRGSPSRGINRGLLTFTRPVFPSPAPPGWNRQRFGFPRASHPAVTSSARRGRGQAIEHGPGTTAQLTSVDLQSGSSLNACDLASHGESEVRGAARTKTRFHRRTGFTSVVPWLGVSEAGPLRVAAIMADRIVDCRAPPWGIVT